MGNSGSHHHLEGSHVSRFGDIAARRSLRTPKRMDRLRKSFRDSFRRRKEQRVPESTKPHQWQADEVAVRNGTCTFNVKYLGCVEVFESRGMQVCEEALKVLRASRRRPVRALLHVSGDGLRVVEEETKGLIVDQTIEKVSFCAPDRNHERGFSYICRDGTTRRWMCHGFLAMRESGERLSHAVGCAFAVCLERKQRRDKECGVTMTFDVKNSTFTRSGSFRQPSLTDRLIEKENGGVLNKPPPVNPFAIERPHATPSMLERQNSFRGFDQLSQASPFKRQLSLRLSDLPSNSERQRNFLSLNTPVTPVKTVSPIPELSPGDSVTALCQQLSQGLSQLTHSESDEFINNNNNTLLTNCTSESNENTKTVIQTYPTNKMTRLSRFQSFDINSTTFNRFANTYSTLEIKEPLNGIIATKSNCDTIEMKTEPLKITESLALKEDDELKKDSDKENESELPKPEQWLGQIASVLPKRPAHTRTMSLGSVDPFDASWATVATETSTANTNPFLAPITSPQAFQI